MQFTKRELHMPRLMAQLATALALGVFLAVTGPFGTYQDLSVGMRYAYWVGLVLVGYLNILIVAHALAALRPHMGHLWRIAIVTLGSAVPTSFAVAWVESLTRLTRPMPLVVLPRLFVSVAVIQLLMLLIFTRLRPSWRALLFTEDAQPAPPPEEAVAPLPAAAAVPQPFMQRIPAHLGQDLLALGAEDHYLRIITAKGSDLILMRLGDALKELAPESGLQVHRSWWVARGAVMSVRRDGARTMLVLGNEQEVPVSRTYLAAVREAGWERPAR